MPQTIRFQSSYEEPYPLQVQGESHYRRNLEDVSGYMGNDEGVDEDALLAHLVLEDDSIYDPGNSVRVEIDGKTVGHLSKPTAKAYRKRLADLGLSDVVGECYASIKGGFIRKDGGQADFGVRLDLDLDTFDETLAQSKTDQSPVINVAPEPAATPAAAPPGPVAVQQKKKSPVLRVIMIAALVFLACFCGLLIYGSYLNMIK